MNIKKISTENRDSKTGLPYFWQITDPNQKEHDWKGFYTGPLVLKESVIEQLCKKLLGVEIKALTETATKELKPVPSLSSVGASIVMHSTTPDLKTFDGDLDKVIKGTTPTDYTSYKEARAVYLASAGDLAVGRIQPWKSGVQLGKLESVEIPGIDYYYLSHALLVLAEQHLREPSPQIIKITNFLKEHKNAVIRLYALEKEMQIFLVWLKRLAGLDHLLMDANSPEVARDWNRKSILFPTVQDALNLEKEIEGFSPHQILAEEAKYSFLRQQLNCKYPVLPGYTIVRGGNDLTMFTNQLLDAAKLLKKRYGLKLGCLKASDSGDGARINVGIDLNKESKLTALAKDAYRHGDDYILEPYVRYNEVIVDGEKLKASPSAHIRWGEVANGLTLQFMEGTSWKGNVFIDEKTTVSYGVSNTHYQTILSCMDRFLAAFQRNNLGLTIAGLDFAIGQIGGLFGEETLIGVQDPNISFNGAECLRVFLEKIRKKEKISDEIPLYGATRIFKPGKACTLDAVDEFSRNASHSGTYVDAIASVPERWAMIAVAHSDAEKIIKQLAVLRADLIKSGLMLG